MNGPTEDRKHFLNKAENVNEASCFGRYMGVNIEKVLINLPIYGQSYSERKERTFCLVKVLYSNLWAHRIDISRRVKLIDTLGVQHSLEFDIFIFTQGTEVRFSSKRSFPYAFPSPENTLEGGAKTRGWLWFDGLPKGVYPSRLIFSFSIFDPGETSGLVQDSETLEVAFAIDFKQLLASSDDFVTLEPELPVPALLPAVHPPDDQWQRFLTYPFSMRTRKFFENAEINSLPQLTNMMEAEVRKYRNVGSKTVAEVRFALAQFGQSLRGDKLSQSESKPENLDSLLQRQAKAEGELREIRRQIEQLQEAKTHRVQLSSAVFAKWLELKDHEKVGEEFSLTPGEVRSIISKTFQQKIKNGDLNELDVFDCWKKAQDYTTVSREFELPEYVVENIILRLKKG